MKNHILDKNTLNKIYNEILDKYFDVDNDNNFDKYAREDAMFAIYHDVNEGKDIKEVFLDIFNIVHGYDLEEDMFQECYDKVMK